MAVSSNQSIELSELGPEEWDSLSSYHPKEGLREQSKACEKVNVCVVYTKNNISFSDGKHSTPSTSLMNKEEANVNEEFSPYEAVLKSNDKRNTTRNNNANQYSEAL